MLLNNYTKNKKNNISPVVMLMQTVLTIQCNISCLSWLQQHSCAEIPKQVTNHGEHMFNDQLFKSRTVTAVWQMTDTSQSADSLQ